MATLAENIICPEEISMPSSPTPSSSSSFTTSNLLPKPSAHRRARSSFATPSVATSRDTSAVWAEDYYCDTEFGDNLGTFSLENKGKRGSTFLQPPEPVALASTPFLRSVSLSSEDEDVYQPPQPDPPQRTLTSFLPFRMPTRSNSVRPNKRPTKENTQPLLDEPFMPTLTGDRDGVNRGEEKQKGGGLSSWFSGSSTPVPVGLITEQESLSPPPKMPSKGVSPEQNSANGQAPSQPDANRSRSSTTTKQRASSTATSRFNFFSGQKSPTKQTIQLPTSMVDKDEFLTLDIGAALFPSSSASAQDPFSPAAFKNLLMNAEGLLLRMQTAYKLRTLSLHELSAEKEAQKEELEEAETRAQCLRAQLIEMSNKVAEQDRTMQDLLEQLAREKQARAEERDAREKSIANIKAQRERSLSDAEDLGISTASSRRRGQSTSSGTSSSDFSEESDHDTDAASSVFSRSRSPTLTVASSESADDFLPFQQSPSSSFRKLTPSQAAADRIAHPNARAGSVDDSGCPNCGGRDASVAWDAVGLLRAENQGLKERVGHLEGAVEMALDLCSGVRGR